jgi:hypothetical protein
MDGLRFDRRISVMDSMGLVLSFWSGLSEI